MVPLRPAVGSRKTIQYRFACLRICEIKRSVRRWISMGAFDANDLKTEPCIYYEDAVLAYPQSGERTRGRRDIPNQLASQPSKRRFTIQRIIGGGDLWVTEFILTYDGRPSYTVSIEGFTGEKVARETQYFADPFVAPALRAQWVERMDT
jgi:SnoaL-like domain